MMGEMSRFYNNVALLQISSVATKQAQAENCVHKPRTLDGEFHPSALSRGLRGIQLCQFTY